MVLTNFSGTTYGETVAGAGIPGRLFLFALTLKVLSLKLIRNKIINSLQFFLQFPIFFHQRAIKLDANGKLSIQFKDFKLV